VREYVRARLSGTESMGAAVHAVIDHFPDAGDAALPDRRQVARIAAGIAISLAVHALLLSSYRQPRPAALPAHATEPLTVRLQEPEKLPAAEPVPPPAQPEPRARPAPRSRPARRIIAVPPPAAPADKEPFKVGTQPAAPADTAPRFNLDAARSVARAVANEPDPARAGTALERLPPPPLQTETKLERAIKAAKRPDCKDGVPGGLLAPIYLMMDKKDSGCKW
jgi:hypothetical protein